MDQELLYLMLVKTVNLIHLYRRKIKWMLKFLIVT